MNSNTRLAQAGFGWSRKEQVKKLATAKPQMMRVQPMDYIGENGLTAKQIEAELKEFGDALHEWAMTPEGQAANQAGWDSYWRTEK